MTGLLPRLCRRLRRRLRREDGNATVELVLLLPVYVAILFTGIEAGLLMTRQVMLERAVDLSLRDLRLGQMEDPSAARLRDAICANTVVIRDCQNALLLELRPIDTTSWAGLDDPVACVNRDEPIQPVTQFHTGGENQLMLVRACVVLDPVIPTSTLALALPRDPSGGVRVLAESVFVNEPN
jgi:hypothetical protein